MKSTLKTILIILFLSSLLISETQAETSSTAIPSRSEIFTESRLRVAAGVTVALNSSGDFSQFNGLGAGWNASAAYQLGVNSMFWVGLGGGSLSGAYLLSSVRYDIALVQPFFMLRTVSGKVHPLMKLGVGPAFRGTQALFSATWAMGADIEITGPVSLSLEPINVSFFTPGNVLSWAPQVNVVAVF